MPVSVVVGGTRRVGRWVSEALLVAGHRVHATYASDQPSAFAFANEMREAEYNIKVHHADALDETQITQIIGVIAEAEGGLNALVNCWGPSVYGSLAETSGVELERMFRGNVLSVHNAVRAALPYLRHAGQAALAEGAADETERPTGGRIVNFITAAAETGRAYRDIAAYGASKAMLFSYSRSLAKELAPHGITVNCISLGVASHAPEGVPAIDADKIPSGRFVNEEDLAAALWYLTSPPASQVTGTVINLGGGFNL
ncbi:MAG: SDR family oxidoreductase [bacterium]|nr:SDR family oxidoreductase [bacterium]